MHNESNKPMLSVREEEAVRQLTLISSLLGGFCITTMTLLLNFEKDILVYLNFVFISLATCLFVGAVLIGSFINLRSTGGAKYSDEEAAKSSLFDSIASVSVMVASGLILFSIGICLLSFQMNLWIGFICTLFAILIFWIVYFVFKNMDTGTRLDDEGGLDS